MHTVIAFATGWGSKYGGINSFNTDFLSDFSFAYHNCVQVVCIVASATEAEIEAARESSCIRLIPLPFLPQDKILSDSHAHAAIAEMERLRIKFIPDETIWLGHDRITGAAALAAAKAAGGRSALIHHMSYDHYESFAENSVAAYEKVQSQKALFQEADVVLAVGPLLRDALSDLLSESKPVHMLIPGLAEITARSAPKTFSVFMSGRLSDDAARIKQGHLGIAAFAKAHCDARNSGLPDGLCDKPKLVLRGVDFESELVGRESSVQTDPETELKAFAEEYAECVINLHALPYTHDRQMLHDDLSAASVAMMPSWHEGFGLVGWEAIAAGVPLILSKDSGVYKLLKENHDGTGTGCVYPIDVKGSVTAPFFRPEDLRAVADKLKEIANKPGEARKRAGNLRGLLADYTWTACAEQAVQAFGWSLQKGSIPPAVIPSVATPPDITASQPNSPATASASPLQMPDKRWQSGVGMADSQLLRAEEALVPFDPARQPELDILSDWLDDPHYPQAVRLVTGAGGVGKTRLALELCGQRTESGWHAGFLNAEIEARDMVGAWKILRTLNQKLLIVIDYAETRQEALLGLVEAILQDQGQKPVRILLLARDGGEWWDNLPSRDSACESLLSGYATCGPFCLPPLHPTEQDRRVAYQLALQTFADVLRVVAPDVVPALEGEHFERPLYVQMAALLALHGERPTTAEGLTRALLNHERRYWSRLLSHFGWIEPERYAQQLLALSTLVGGFATPRTAQSLLKAASVNPLKDGEFSALFHALVPLYPGKQGLQAVRPDLLGEALVAQALLTPEAANLLNAVLASNISTSVRRHVLTVLTRLASQRHDLHEILVETLKDNFTYCFKEIIEVAIETNGALPTLAETAFTRLLPAQKSQISGVLEPLIREESVQLVNLGCLVMEYLVEKCRQKLAKRPGSVELMYGYAIALTNYAVDLSRAGRDEDALVYGQKSLNIYEKLVNIDNTRFEPSYARSLNNCSGYFSNTEQYDAALTHSRQGLEIRQRLALKNPEIYEYDYAQSLNNFAGDLSYAERNEEAFEHSLQSLQIHQRLAQKYPDRYEPGFAMLLNNFSNSLGDAGRYAEALKHALQSLEICQRLAQKKPDRYETDFAMALYTSAYRLSDVVNYIDALKNARQSLEIYQRLARKNPIRFSEDLFSCTYLVKLQNWLCSFSEKNVGEANLHDLRSTTSSRRHSLMRLYVAFIEACQATKQSESFAAFAQILTIWVELTLRNRVDAQPYWLCAAAWCAKYAPDSVTDLGWQTELHQFARQRQGNLPRWMLTVAERLDFSFDLSSVVTAAPQNVSSDDGGVPCPSV